MRCLAGFGMVVMTLLALSSPLAAEVDRTDSPAQSSHSGAAACRMEYIIEADLDTDPLPYFVASYPSIRFVRHHTMNGFYAFDGDRQGLLAVRRDLLEMERTGKVPPVPELSPIPLAYLDAASALELLKLRVGGVECSENGSSSILLFGDPEVRHEAAQALKEIDRPSVWLRLSRELLSQFSGGLCRLPARDSHAPFRCPAGDCGGPLHVLGLRQDDIVLWSRQRVAGEPLWVVLRKGIRTNVYVDFY